MIIQYCNAVGEPEQHGARPLPMMGAVCATAAAVLVTGIKMLGECRPYPVPGPSTYRGGGPGATVTYQVDLVGSAARSLLSHIAVAHVCPLLGGTLLLASLLYDTWCP